MATKLVYFRAIFNFLCFGRFKCKISKTQNKKSPTVGHGLNFRQKFKHLIICLVRQTY